MTEKLRAFVAVELSEAMKAALGEVINALAANDQRGLRLVRPESVHLTLSFLGDIEARRIAPIVESIGIAASAHHPFDIGLDRPGVFPSPRSPRVLWIGVAGDLPELASLQDSVAAELSELGFERERRSFSPHLTVGRFRDTTNAAVRRDRTQSFLSADVPGDASMRVDEISLMRSRLYRGGAVYNRIASVPLGGYTDSSVTD